MDVLLLITIHLLFSILLILTYHIGKSKGYAEGSNQSIKALKQVYGKNFREVLENHRTSHSK